MNGDRLTVSQDPDGSLRILVPSDVVVDQDTPDSGRVELATLKAKHEKETGRTILVIRIALGFGRSRTGHDSRNEGETFTNGPEVDDEGGMSEYRYTGRDWP